jgi:hypothetical protein
LHAFPKLLDLKDLLVGDRADFLQIIENREFRGKFFEISNLLDLLSRIGTEPSLGLVGC